MRKRKKRLVIFGAIMVVALILGGSYYKIKKAELLENTVLLQSFSKATISCKMERNSI